MNQQLTNCKKGKTSRSRFIQSQALTEEYFNVNFSEEFYLKLLSLRKVFGINKHLPSKPEILSCRTSKELLSPNGGSMTSTLSSTKSLPLIESRAYIKRKKEYTPYYVTKNLAEEVNGYSGSCEVLKSDEQVEKSQMGSLRLPKTKNSAFRRQMLPALKKNKGKNSDREEVDLITGWE